MKLILHLSDSRVRLEQRCYDPTGEESELIELYSEKATNREDALRWHVGEAIIKVMGSYDGLYGPVEIHVSDERERWKLEQQYDCKHEEAPLLITSPGKFEGEPLWVAYYYNLMCEVAQSGSFHFASETIDYFELDEADFEIWPELKHGGGCGDEDPCAAICLNYSDDGFVAGIHFSKSEWVREKERLEKAEMENDADEESDHDHVWGPIESGHFTGAAFRRCTVPGCTVVSHDNPEDDDI